ncbi:MAG: YjbQ family protein [Gemmatimonadetes bacterium]|jgi:secondary thiamine-phosphate synthase enzyme|nr:YjbQ family protein [Gemmatimonadota bacterium]
MTRIDITTTGGTEMVAVTNKVQQAVTESGMRNGVCHLFVPHTTAAVTINENTDAAVPQDALHVINSIVPFNDPDYRHAEGNSAAHLKTMLIGSSETIPIQDGQLALGTWQGIFFCEFDGPRSRQLVVKLIEG